MAAGKHWDIIQARYDVLLQESTSASLEPKKRKEIQRELSHLGDLLAQRKALDAIDASIADVRAQLDSESDAELRALFADEVEALILQRASKERELDEMMIAPDEHADRSVYLEIRAGAGGQEAALFVDDLLKMYMHYADQKGWKASIESASLTDLGGYREVVLYIKGKDVYGHLKYESGVHRVQRVPQTETQGRVHTSTATVAVLPEAQEVDVDINPADLRIDVYRASGAGGQHVNTTDSAVRITHIPTGVVVACQDERSQHKNKAKAMKILQSRILAAQVEQQHMEMAQRRKELVGTGMRAEKVRTYNYPQNRVTDHQVDLTLKKLEYVMLGALDEIIDALRVREREMRRQEFLSKF